VDRRRFIGAALAAGVAGRGLSACHNKAALPLTGRLLGPDPGLGHRLRGGEFPPPAARRAAPIVIAGGGIAGLSAAWWLRRQGFTDFVLLESETETGGNARSGSSEVTRYPWGAHYLPMPSREATALVQLLEDLGIVTGRSAAGEPVYDERYLVFAPRERLFFDGEWRGALRETDDAGSREQFARFDSLLDDWREKKGADGRDAFASPSPLSSRDPRIRELDRISMAQWLAQHALGDPQLRWYVDYACRDDFGCVAAETSAWAGLHYFLGRKAPASYPSAPVLTAPEGNGFLAGPLAALCRKQIATGQMVYRVEQHQGYVEILSCEGPRSTAWRARQAILAVPQFVLPHILVGAARNGFEYAPWVVANLHVRELPQGRGAPPAWDNVLYDSPALGYVAATHQALRQHVGASVLTWYMPLTQSPAAAAREQLLDASWKQWVDVILADLRRAHREIDELVTHVDVWRWGHGMIKPLPGTITGTALSQARMSRRNIHFAHSDLSGMSLFEEAHYWGVQAARRALDALS